MKKTFYSNGKLLITAEYVVLDGAKAFALPTKFGQYLHVDPGENSEIKWTSFDKDGSVWFEETLSFEAIKQHTSKEDSVKNTLIEILHAAYLMNPEFINDGEGYHITTTLTFPRYWGLGTSSTLINNLAQWLAIDAFKLLQKSFGGSGYDIACAQNNTPITYQLIEGKPIVNAVHFNPAFVDHLYFVYLNRKQSSKKAIAAYYKRQNALDKIIPAINTITDAVLNSNDLNTFAGQLEKHEIMLSHLLETETAKENLFYDFKGVIKSLGAWGGDFVLAISKENPTAYFQEKGFETIIPYQEMVLS